jgi:hypothetical protein
MTTEATLAPELQARVKATPEEMSKLIDLDHATMLVSCAPKLPLPVRWLRSTVGVCPWRVLSEQS